MPSSLLPPSAAEIQQSFASRKAFVDFYHKQLDVAQLRKLCKDAGIKYAADKASAKVLCGKIYDRLHRWKWLERIGIGMSGLLGLLLGVGSGAQSMIMNDTQEAQLCQQNDNCKAGNDSNAEELCSSSSSSSSSSSRRSLNSNSTAEDGGDADGGDACPTDNVAPLLATLLAFASLASYGAYYTTHTKRTTLRNKVVSALSTSAQRRTKRRAPQSLQKKASAKS